LKQPLKLKQDFVIGGYRPATAGLELLLVGFFENSKFLFAGKVRQGLNRWNRAAMFKRLKSLRVRHSPFVNLPNSRSDHFGESVTKEEMRDYVWVRPELVAEVKFGEWTRGNVLRHAEFLAIREDKGPADVVRDG